MQELKGNKPHLWEGIYTGGGTGTEPGYQIPGEALSDPSFATLIGEAEKYLGYPYGATCSQLKRLGTCPMIGGEKKDR